MEERQSAIEREMETVVTRYGTRFWAVYLNGQLLAVTVYKKGARAVQDELNRRKRPFRSNLILKSDTDAINSEHQGANGR